MVEDGAPIELASGDLVVLPRGDRHTLLSERGVTPTPFKQVLEASGIDSRWTPGRRLAEPGRIRFGGRGALTRIATGPRA